MVGFIPLKISTVKGSQYYMKVMKQVTHLAQLQFVVSEQ